MTAIEVYDGNCGETTKRYYQLLDSLGPAGKIATALFRAHKRSSRAKAYRGRRFKDAAYDVKNWSIGVLCQLLEKHAGELGIIWGWGHDKTQAFHSWVLYVELPQGQVSFHSSTRSAGPDYASAWCGKHDSGEKIIQFCDLLTSRVVSAITE